MITVRFLPAADWPALAAGFRDLGFEQSLTYGQAAAARVGATARFVALERDGRVLAAACVRTRALPGLGRGIAWIAAGPLVLPVAGPTPDAATLVGVLAALRRQFALHEGHVLRLRLSATALQDPAALTGLAATAGFRPTPRSPAYRSLAIALKKDPARLLADLNGKWRTDLRYAQKSGLTLEHGDTPALQTRFLAMFETIQATKGFRPDITPQFHFALSGPDYARDILIATRDGQDLAGIVIGSTGPVAVYLFGATAEAGRALRAGYFLTWEGIALARGRGLDWYDLGGIDAEANPDVARFKDRMNGTPLLAPAFETRGGGPVAALIRGLETLRARLRR